MSKKNGSKKGRTTSLEYAIDQSIDLTLSRSAAMGEQLMEHVLRTDPEIKTFLGQLAKERVKRALRDLGVKASGT
jgi:hypothetical protein